MKPTYKTPRKYKCPYCGFKALRGELIDHVDKKHEELIPEGYSAARCVFDFINGRNHGTCMICHEDVYRWNEKINRYYNLCEKPECRKRVREIALERHIRVHNKPTLLNDPEQQEKMLANRKISGSYSFLDGTKVTYTGKYEKNALEFIDKVLEIPGSDIQCPGPVLEYIYNGKSHKYISDIYYIPANLLIEVKDGGSNPNNRSMNEYREKQIAKEEMITNMGKFNYVRLTDNQFAQLLDILADIKNEVLNSENPKAKIHINEEVGGLPPHMPPEAYIVPFGMNNIFDGFAYGDSNIEDIYLYDSQGELIQVDEDAFSFIYDHGPRLYYKGDDIKEKMNLIHEFIKNTKFNSNKMYFAEVLADRKIRYAKDILFTECFEYYDEEREKRICSLIENAVEMRLKEENFSFSDSNVIETIGNVLICHSPRGYYACTRKEFYMCSDYFSDIESLKSSDVIKLMNDVYNQRREY